jgi:xanthine dehydrogenase/oxidase
MLRLVAVPRRPPARGLRRQVLAASNNNSNTHSRRTLSSSNNGSRSSSSSASSQGDALHLVVNRRRVTVQPGSSAMDQSLLTYLRGSGLTGTKRVCEEGGCGACSVVVSEWDPTTKAVVHRAVTSCVQPMAKMHRKQVTTVEGLGALSPKGVHPVAEAFASMGASQCGFCSPGFLSSLSARLAQPGPAPTQDEIKHVFDGNLCRCTGYRPILEASSTFAKDAPDIISGACVCACA